MTVEELIKQLEEVDENKQVYVRDGTQDSASEPLTKVFDIEASNFRAIVLESG